MAEITLGGKTWEIPPLPWRAARKIQPALAQVLALTGGRAGLDAFAKLGEAEVDRLAGCVHEATRYATSGEALTREQFDDLPFGIQDVIGALFPAIASAIGMKVVSAAEGDDPGKASTGQG